MADPIQVANSAAQLEGKTLVTAEDFQAITGQKTFDRAPDPPFEVVVGSALVANLDADLLDGEEGSAYHNASNLNDGTVPAARFPNPLPAVSGENLTNLDAANLTGVIPAGAVPDPLPAVSGENLTGLDATELTGAVPSASLTSVPAGNLTGTVPDDAMPDPLPAVSGENLTNVARLATCQYNDVATSGTAETDLHSFVVPAGKLAIGDYIQLECWVETDLNTNAKNHWVRVGALSVDVVPVAATQQWSVRATIIRTGEATAMIRITLTRASSNGYVFTSGAVTWSGDVTIKTVGKNATSGLFTERAMVAMHIS